MGTTAMETEAVGDGVPDLPLIVEDLLCQIADLRATEGDPTAIAELWAQVDLLQGW